MKHVLLLGAGLVSPPIIDYLTEQEGIFLTVADISIENAERLLKGKFHCAATLMDIHDGNALDTLIKGADVVVSLLPYTMHPIVAKHCIQMGKPMVNASYISDEIKALNASAKEAGVLILCEIGLDPGIDHMSAMKIIKAEQDKGNKIDLFHSYCGGVPSPESANNPFKYKFSWSPKGVLMAGNNSALFLENNVEISVEGKYLFDNSWSLNVENFDYEAYPNRDSMEYIDIYGLKGIKSMLRGTLRFKGWSHIMNVVKDLDLLSEEALPSPEMSFLDIINHVNNKNDDASDYADELISNGHEKEAIDALKWLGVFSETKREWRSNTPVDCLAELMSENMSYESGEKDMVVMHHEFVVTEKDGKQKKITSTLIDYGIENGASSMARTVSLPVAISVKLILDGKIKMTGVQIPVHPEIYEPVLAELETVGIKFKETETKLK